MSPEAAQLRAKNNLEALPEALDRDDASWCVNAGAEDTKRVCDKLKAKPGPRSTRILQAAYDYEKANSNRSSRLKLITAALRKVESPLKKAAAKSAAKDGNFEIATPVHDLDELARALESERDHVIQHEEAFKDATLPRYLRMGLACLKAQAVFAHNPGKGGNPTGKNQHSKEELSAGTVPPADTPPETFSDWLSRAVPWLKRTNVYRYAAAAKGLGLTTDSTDSDVEPALKKLRADHAKHGLPKPSLAILCHKAKAAEEETDDDDDQPADPNTPEARAGEARVVLHEFQTEFVSFVGRGDLDFLGPDDLRPFCQFLEDELDRFKKLLKSAAK